MQAELLESDAEAQLLETIAHQQGKPMSELAREWLQQLVRLSPAPLELTESRQSQIVQSEGADALEIRAMQIAPNCYKFMVFVNSQIHASNPLSVAGKHHSGQGDIAINHDKYLAEIFGEW